MASPSKADLAADAWRRLFRFFISTRAQRDEVLGRHSLTPNDIRALSSLDRHQDRTMRSLSEEWGCDASNATWIVDRLEQRGFARRSTPEVDRRIKHVVLTALGEKLKRQVWSELNEPPKELLALDISQLTALRDALSGLPELPPGRIEMGSQPRRAKRRSKR